MIFFDLRLGGYSILALSEPNVCFGARHEGVGEVVIDLPYVSLTFTNYAKTLARLSQ